MNVTDYDDTELLPLTSGLQCTGFWSDRNVVVNTTDQILWDSRVTPEEAAAYLNESASLAFRDYFATMANAMLKHANEADANRSVSYVLKAYGIRGKWLNEWARSMASLKHGRYADYGAALRHLIEITSDLNEAAAVIADVYRPLVQLGDYANLLTSEFTSRMDSPSSIVRINWKQVLQSDNAAKDLVRIAKLGSALLVNATTPGGKNAVAIKEQLGPLASPIPVSHDIFRISNTQSKHVNTMNILGLRKAAEWGLLALIRKGWLLMPLRWNSLNDSRVLYGDAWWQELGEFLPYEIGWSRRLFMRLVCTTTARSPADWSPELCLQYNPSTTGLGGSMVKGFNQAIQRYQLTNPGAKLFPIGEINNRRKIHLKAEDDREGSPGQLREAGMHDWAEAIEIFYKLSKTTRDGKRAAVKPLLDWAIAFGHTTPWRVNVSHLINPLRLDDKTTFHAFLSRSSGNKMTLWSGSARFYSVVCNALKPIPEYDHKGIRNPFDGLSNPYGQREDRRATIGKTHRRLIPADLLNAMLDTLLDCDETGVPQYTWVKQRFKVDHAERFNYQAGEYEVVWHPARARCLALLLLIPLRSKQARWLDQGLMDTHRWDLGSNSWTTNHHPLAGFRYPSGQLHSEHYGRPSGILQPLDSLLGGNASHVGLYINTNKTQLWNPQSRTGYAIPWPDGKEMRSSSDKRVREQGRRLGLAYDLIRDQISWMEMYDRTPTPVTFSEDAEEYGPEVRNLLPAFCPIFRDLVSPASRADGTPVHVPVSKQKIDLLFHALAAETEDRLVARGYDRDSLGLTVEKRNANIAIKLGRTELLRRCSYDIHSLRVAGITHLLEMGVPAHIVSEFIAGHMALVMTLHYAKFQPLKLRQQLMDVFNEADSIRKFEDALSARGVNESLLVVNHRFDRAKRPDPTEVFQVKGTWRYINGGICPGASCDDGGIRVVTTAHSLKDELIPVPGGPESCGNCRFFLTSPAFIVPQMLTANSIMLQLRELGRYRKQLWDKKANLELAMFEGDATSRDRIQQRTIEAELERIDRRLEPMILEWYNRFEMFRASLDLIPKWDSFEPRETGRLMLLGSDEGARVHASLDPEGSDYTLVKEIVAQAEMLGGLRPVSELAEHKLREFVDRVLVQEHVPDLLLSMPDGSRRRQATLMLADSIEILAGNGSSIVHDRPVSQLAAESSRMLRELAARLAADPDANPNQDIPENRRSIEEAI